MEYVDFILNRNYVWEYNTLLLISIIYNQVKVFKSILFCVW